MPEKGEYKFEVRKYSTINIKLLAQANNALNTI